MKANVISMVVIVVAHGLAMLRYLHQPWTPLRIAGAVVSLISLTFVLLARIQLGRSFTIRAQARHLITTGLYSRIRNPIYVFGCGYIVGIAMFLPAWWPIVVLIILIPVQIARSRKEAAVLEAAFGEEYTRYRKSTWL